MYRINYENMTGLTVCVLISLALLKCVHCHKVHKVQVYYSCYVAVCPSSINAASELVSRAQKKAEAAAVGVRLSHEAKKGQYYTVCTYYCQAQHQRPDSGL